MTYLDPRVEAAVKVIGPTLHGWHDGFAEGECPECQEVTRDALAAADAVDPLRQPGVIHRVAKRVSELATAYSPGRGCPKC